MPNLYAMAQPLSKNVIRHLNSLKIKKYRYTHREFIVEGPKVVEEFLHAGWEAISVFTVNRDLLPLLEFEKIVLVSDGELKKISALQTPNSILAVFRMPETLPEEVTFNQWTIALEGIRDPGNLGTIIRVADWFGIGLVVCSPDCADPFNPKTVQASMGSLARVKLLETDLPSFFRLQATVPVFGALLNGTSYKEVDYPSAGILLIGNESAGISDTLLPFITKPITIPRYGQAESLNAAIATAIICSELSHH